LSQQFCPEVRPGPFHDRVLFRPPLPHPRLDPIRPVRVVVYTPPSPTFTGTTSFTYRLFDGVATSNTATVSLTVAANNAAPVAVNDAYTTKQGIALATQHDLSVLANDTDADLGGGNVGLKAVLVSGPTTAQGTLTLNQGGTFVFTTTAAFFGYATFTYKVNDGSRDSNTATATIAVVQTNDGWDLPIGLW
jgi:Big-like domain-containing protein